MLCPTPGCKYDGVVGRAQGSNAKQQTTASPPVTVGTVMTWGYGTNLGHADLYVVSPRVVHALRGVRAVSLHFSAKSGAVVDENHRLHYWTNQYGREKPFGVKDDVRFARRDVTCFQNGVLLARSTVREAHVPTGAAIIDAAMAGQDCYTVADDGCLHSIDVFSSCIKVKRDVEGKVVGLATDKAGTRVLLWTESGQLFKCGKFDVELVEGLKECTIIKAAVGSIHYAAVTDNGEVLTWGANKNGRLGYLTELPEVVLPQKVPLAAFIVDVVCCSHTMALSRCGRVFMFTPKGIEVMEVLLPYFVRQIAICDSTRGVIVDPRCWSAKRHMELPTECRLAILTALLCLPDMPFDVLGIIFKLATRNWY